MRKGGKKGGFGNFLLWSLVYFSFFLVLGFLFLIILQLFPLPAAPSVRLQNYFGSVEMLTATAPGWHKPGQGDELRPFERVRTGSGGRATLETDGGLSIRLKENTEMELRVPSQLTGSINQFHLIRGSFFAETVESRKGRHFRLSFEGPSKGFKIGFLKVRMSMPSLDVKIRQGTVSAERDAATGRTVLKVIRGRVNVRNRIWKPYRTVEEGREVVLESGMTVPEVHSFG